MEKPISIYGYIIPNDTGFSPCYAEGILTLACCKPRIRQSIYNDNLNHEHWLVGVKHDGMKKDEVYNSKIIYIARITKIIRLEDYYKDDGIFSKRCDCIYRNVKSFEKAENRSYDIIIEYMNNEKNKIYHIPNSSDHAFDHENPTDSQKNQIRKDLYGNCVLYSDDFYYLADKDVDTTKVMSSLHEQCKVRKPGDSFKVENLKQFNKEAFYSFIKKIGKYKNLKSIQPCDYKGTSKYTGLLENSNKSSGGCSK